MTPPNPRPYFDRASKQLDQQDLEFVLFSAFVDDAGLAFKIEAFSDQPFTGASWAPEVGPADCLTIHMKTVQNDGVSAVADRAWNQLVLRRLTCASAFFALHIPEEFWLFPI
ncbi:MAG: hypothetical protein RDU25_01095 [Patescibacteria group bacterium]|nr:hypothetical protein [Patescibacteria group bacterium]